MAVSTEPIGIIALSPGAGARDEERLPATAAHAATCPLCGGTAGCPAPDDRTASIRGVVRLCRCGACGFVFAADAADAGTEDGYYDSMGGYQRFVEVKKDEWRALFRDLARLAPGRRLLEVGCARGHALALSREMGWVPCGIEISRDDAARARADFGLSVWSGTLETCPFDDGSFDVITMWSVIEHIARPLPALRACRRLLAPGGLLSVATCNVDSAAAASAGPDWSMFRLPGHVSFFSPPTMRRALAACGFEVVRLETGLGGRPVNVDPAARRRLTARRVASRVAGRLGIKEPLRRAILALSPELRERGEFMNIVARGK